MECTCGGALIEGRSTYSISKDHFSFVLEDVPAYKCTRCDKVLFTDETVEKIQKLVNRVERETDEIVKGQPSANLYEY